MTWHFNGAPVPTDENSGFLIIGETQYPPSWPVDELTAMGLEWVEPETPEEPEPEPPSVDELTAAVDAERDRRIDGGFTFAGHRFQSRPSDRENVMGAAQLALAAMSQGAGAGNLRWADPDQDFVWITAENDLFPMDAPTTVGLFQAGVAFKSRLTFYARGLKDALLAAEDPSLVDRENGWPE